MKACHGNGASLTEKEIFDILHYAAIAEHTKPPIQMIEFGTRWRDKRTVNESGTPICAVSM